MSRSRKARSEATLSGIGPVPLNAPPRLLVLACGALASEIVYFTRLNGWDHVTLACLPARLHNTPDRIVPELEARLRAVAGRYDKVLIGYGDCGTGGHLDMLIDRWENVERLPGAHCYEFFATSPVFTELHEAELGTFYLTDFLARHFEPLRLGSSRARQASSTPGHVLRELPEARLPVPARRSGAGGPRPGGRPSPGPRVQSPSGRPRRPGYEPGALRRFGDRLIRTVPADPAPREVHTP